MSVYFAQCGDYIKVGHSSNVMQRIASLPSCYTKRPADLARTLPIRLIGWLPGTKRDELLAHAALNDFWVLGEWYRDTPEVRAYLTDRDDAAILSDLSALAMFEILAGTSVAEAKAMYPLGDERESWRSQVERMGGSS